MASRTQASCRAELDRRVGEAVRSDRDGGEREDVAPPKPALPILLIGTDSQVGRVMLRRLRNREDIETYASLDEMPDDMGPQPRLVIIGTRIDVDEAIDVVARLTSDRLDLAAILLAENHDSELLERALRAGFSDVLPPAALEELDAAIDRIGSRLYVGSRFDRPRRDRPANQIVAVVSAKGGVGKTVVSTNLALALAIRGVSTALIDTDFEFGDVALMLKVAPTTDIGRVAESGEILDDAFAGNDFRFAEQPKLRVLPAPLDPMAATPPDSDTVTRMLARIRNRHAEITVVDTPPQLGHQNLELLELADQVIFVTQADLANAKALKIALPGLYAIGLERHNLHVVMNRSQSKARLDERELARTVGIKPVCNLPSTVQVPRSINEGLPLALSSRRSDFANEIDALAERVWTHAAMHT